MIGYDMSSMITVSIIAASIIVGSMNYQSETLTYQPADVQPQPTIQVQKTTTVQSVQPSTTINLNAALYTTHGKARIVKAPVESIEPITAVPNALATTYRHRPVAKVPVVQRSLYPANLANAPIDTIVDDWGNWNRQCVSYTAWRVASSGRRMPAWWANANQWLSRAVGSGISTSSEPKVGSVGVNNSGKFGHTVYVERILSNGRISISQYNADGRGTYSTATVSVSSFMYIYF